MNVYSFLKIHIRRLSNDELDKVFGIVSVEVDKRSLGVKTDDIDKEVRG